ncbi:MAG: hypothetical protein Q8L48_14045 [Archangium sp.]|nr:hypothetical protein [Archangium sp.]
MRAPLIVLSSLVLFTCGQAPGTLAPQFGAAPACESGQSWKGGTVENEQMNPGFACRSCHLGQNFQGQNPNGQPEPDKAFFFMGTAYSVPNEADLCAAAGVPSDAVVEILDTNDVVKLTLPINAAGNFRSLSTTATVPVPYKARVKANGKVNAMAAAQTNGDCNTCHTAAGLEGAPGRVLFPQ